MFDIILNREELFNLYYKHYKEYQNASAKEVTFKYGQFLGVRNCVKILLSEEESERIFKSAVLNYEFEHDRGLL